MLKKCYKASIKLVLFVVAVTGGVATANACEVPSNWMVMNAQNPGTGTNTGDVVINLENLPVAIGKPFDIQIAVCAPNLGKVERVAIDATMPAHKHGMNYKPDVTSMDAGIKYKASGLFFHMPGQWRITVDVYGGRSGESFSIDVPAK